MKTINIFEIISRVNNDFSNHVFIPRSFPSVDVKFNSDRDNYIITIKTYIDDNPEDMVGNLKIEWNHNDRVPNYHIVSNTEQTQDGEKSVWNELDYQTTSIFSVISEVLGVLVTEDEPSHDEDPDCWNSGMYPDEYYDYCLNNRTGIFKGITEKTKLDCPWY